MIKKLIATLFLICILIASCMVAIFIPKEEIDLKIGVLGEIALPDRNGKAHLEESLKILRNENCNVIVIVGNLTNGEQEKYYPVFQNSLKKVFGNKIPRIVYPQGERDKNLNLYNKHFGNEFEVIDLGEVNILKLPYKQIITDEYLLQVKSQLDLIKQKDTKCFIASYTPPKSTFYGSEDGSESLRNLVNKYSNVIWLSKGKHSQISNKATYNYINNYYIGIEPLNRISTPYVSLVNSSSDARGMIFEIENKEITIEKWNFTEKKKESRYSLSNFKKKTTAPVFLNKEYSFFEKNFKSYFTFSAAYSDDFVFAYQIILTYSNEIESSFTQNVYASDYFLGKDKMANSYTIEISSGTTGLISVGVKAIDDYFKESQIWTCDYNLRNTETEF